MNRSGAVGLLVGAMALVASLIAAPVASADVTFNVNDTTDAPLATAGSTNCASTNNNTCTLRAAIQAANNQPNTAGNVTINLPAGTYKLTIAPSGNDDASTGDLNINYSAGAVTIAGAGSGSTIVDGNFLDRVFNTGANTTVTISGMTIQNGRPGGIGHLTSCSSEGSTTASGGGILDSGALTLSSAVLKGNLTEGDGGAVEDNGTQPLTITGSTLDGNAACKPSVFFPAFGNGGAVDESHGAAVTIDSSTIDENQANLNGGGVDEAGAINQASGSLTITNSTLSGNTAANNAGNNGEGGAVSGEGSPGTEHLFADVLTGNSSPGGGGGVGGTDMVSIVNSTITQNTASSGGGGVEADGADTISFSTVNANTATSSPGGNIVTGGEAGTVALDDSIVAGGKGPGGNPDNCANNVGGGITSNGHNLFDDSGTSCGKAASDVVNADPKLSSLANNGGPTQTEALQAGSPAIDAADDTRCPETKNSSNAQVDERGYPRPQGSHCDIGAFEATPDLGLSASAAANPINTGDQDTVTDSVTNSGPYPATNTTFTDPAAGFTIDSVTPSQGSCTHTDTTVSCSLGTVAPGQTVTIQIVLTANSAGTITLNSAVSTDLFDPNSGNNTASLSITVNQTPPPPPPPPPNAQADLKITQNVSRHHPLVGQTLTYKLTITNKGPQTGTGVTVKDHLPQGVDFVSVSRHHACRGGRKIRCLLGTLGVGQRVRINIVVRVVRARRLVNRSTVSGTVPDPNLANNHATTRVNPTAACLADFKMKAVYDPDDAVAQIELSVNGRVVRRFGGFGGGGLSRTVTIHRLRAKRNVKIKIVETLVDLRQAIATRNVSFCKPGKVIQSFFVPPHHISEVP
jgi:uncharacterized repeat protein (TIGR01451 family)